MLEASRLRSLLVLLGLAFVLVLVASVRPGAAQADETVWICKPGQSDDLCAGTMEGVSWPAPGQLAEPLGYTRPSAAPVDCFYLYPTQSEQETPNSDLEKDPPIRRVVVQQARMFSSVCNVYAPMHRQVTYNGNQGANSPDVEVAYASVKAAFQEYLDKYNQGRGFILLGHSQGSAHTARLIDEMVDKDAKLRERFVGAIAPGANIYVPIGQDIGGMYENVPVCSREGQYGCLIAFSAYTDVPGAGSMFSRLDVGYWIYPEARPDSGRYEVVCANPAALDGSNGTMLPLVNLDYLSGVPAAETSSPWASAPDYYTSECKREGGAHWLNVAKINLPGDERLNLGEVAGAGTNWHVPEFNLAEGNLLRIVQKQSDSYLAELDRIKLEAERIAELNANLAGLNAKLAKAKKRQTRNLKTVKRLSVKLKKAGSKQQRRKLKRKLKANRRKVTAERKRIKSIQGQIASITAQLG